VRSRSAEPDAPLADDVEYTGVDLSDLVLDGSLAGGRVWRGRRFVDCTFHDADMRGLATEQCSFDGCRFRGTDLGDSAHRGSAFPLGILQGEVSADSDKMMIVILLQNPK